MKLTVALLAAGATVAMATPHVGHHHHQHVHKRGEQATEVKVVPGPTVVAYMFEGHPISEHEVKEGLKNGTLTIVGGNLAPVETPSAYTSSTPAPTSTYVAPTSTPSPPPPPPPPTSSPSPSPSPSPPSSPPSGGSSWGSSGTGLNTPFPNGQVSCSDFPSDYGAIPVDWLNLGGWTGIQKPGSNNGGFSNIETATSGGCTEGAYCSYACPPGWQKAQWPTTQGATGQSVGGLLCQNGKLQLTNPGLSNTLCIQGASEVTIQVQNTLGQQVAVCRTDYPGTESETVPLDAQPGATVPLTCPNADNYYNWQGAHTSAQYYVNPSGVSVQDGCQWGSDANPWGNYAPLNLGVGYSNGAAWLSIFQNAPTTDAKLDFTVEIKGDGISGTCRYSNGQYCGGANYDQCSSTTGCTVSLSSGTATFVFSS